METSAIPTDVSVLEELVTANRILANEGIVDSFGHISMRHPHAADRYLLACSRSPAQVEAADIMEFTIDGTAIDPRGRSPVLERFIHGTIYEARPDVHCVIHNHSPSVIPFGVTGQELRPLFHLGATFGHRVPIWDSATRFGDTSLLVTNMDMGRDLAQHLGSGRAALMRGHGCVVAGPVLRATVFIAIQMELNAELHIKASALGNITFLTDGEVDRILASFSSYGWERAWENWCRRANRPYVSAK